MKNIFAAKEKCKKCNKTVYFMEKVSANECGTCKKKLNVSNYQFFEDAVYCKIHYQEIHKAALAEKKKTVVVTNLKDVEKAKLIHSNEEEIKNTTLKENKIKEEVKKKEEKEEYVQKKVNKLLKVKTHQHEQKNEEVTLDENNGEQTKKKRSLAAIKVEGKFLNEEEDSSLEKAHDATFENDFEDEEMGMLPNNDTPTEQLNTPLIVETPSSIQPDTPFEDSSQTIDENNEVHDSTPEDHQETATDSIVKKKRRTGVIIMNHSVGENLPQHPDTMVEDEEDTSIEKAHDATFENGIDDEEMGMLPNNDTPTDQQNTPLVVETPSDYYPETPMEEVKEISDETPLEEVTDEISQEEAKQINDEIPLEENSNEKDPTREEELQQNESTQEEISGEKHENTEKEQQDELEHENPTAEEKDDTVEQKDSKVAGGSKAFPITDESEDQIILSVPNKLHQYCIGKGGSVIKEISSKSSCKLNLQGDNVEIKGENKKHAMELVMNALSEVGWFFENNEWVERTKQDELWKKYRGEAQKEVELRNECFEKSKKAFEDGDKELAKQLSEEGKEHDEKWKVLTKEAGRNIFNEMNEKNEKNVIDLHGLFVEEAIEFVQERINELKGQGGITLSIITGAGNHSTAGALIKPKIHELLQNENLSFKEEKNGQVDVEIN